MSHDHLEDLIGEWRDYVSRGTPVNDREVEELEDHLRLQISDLVPAGLSPDEAFLIAVKRMGGVDEMSREFAREYSGRLWRQLVVTGATDGAPTDSGWRVASLLATAAAVTVLVARLAAGFPGEEAPWVVRNGVLFVLPFLAAYFAVRRGLTSRQLWLTAIVPVVTAVLINIYPFAEDGSTEVLVAAHLPLVLWFVVAFPYMGGTLRSHERRMDFVRFTGEWVVYFALLALGGGVLMALMVLILEPTGVDAALVVEWVVVPGAAGAVIVAAWLVEAKQRVVENMAPVLTMVFTPLFAVLLIVATVIYAGTGLGAAFDRELLGVFDAMLVVVFGLVLYRTSARDPSEPPGWMDGIQLTAVIGALVLDLMVLGVMVARIGELGFTPNRTAALGLNVVLLVSLAGSAWLSAQFLAGRGAFSRIERWQTGYLPVLAVWAAVVVFVVPPLFSFT